MQPCLLLSAGTRRLATTTPSTSRRRRSRGPIGRGVTASTPSCLSTPGSTQMHPATLFQPHSATGAATARRSSAHRTGAVDPSTTAAPPRSGDPHTQRRARAGRGPRARAPPPSRQLPDRERGRCSCCKEFEGLRYREIAHLLGIPIGTVMSRLYDRAVVGWRRVIEEIAVRTEDADRSHGCARVNLMMAALDDELSAGGARSSSSGLLEADAGARREEFESACSKVKDAHR